MPIRFDSKEQAALAWMFLKWTALGAWVGILSGTASYIFLKSLEFANAYRAVHPQILFGLPFAGIMIAVIYNGYGKSVEGGNNLLLERVHEPGNVVPFRMAPLILITTVLTHLFGGSAGREGTAVQMGGTLANLACGPLKLSPADRRILIMAGIAGGFGSVFGTPLAGAIFGLEVLSIGRIKYDALVPCLVASFVGDLACRGLGIEHQSYQPLVGTIPPMSAGLFATLVLAGVLFAVASALFSELTHGINFTLKKWVNAFWLRPVLGGLAIIGATWVIGSQDFNGLSLGLIHDSFTTKFFLSAFLVKIGFTAITLGSGFKGGEVTPLFCIGTLLGNALAQVTHQPIGFFAALGFVSVFAGAANTPLACVIMGIEIFGSTLAMPLAITCVIAYVFSGHRGIYASQRVGQSKASYIATPEGGTLGSIRKDGVSVVRPELIRRLFKRRTD